jgi:hypothetical protein
MCKRRPEASPTTIKLWESLAMSPSWASSTCASEPSGCSAHPFLRFDRVHLERSQQIKRIETGV